MSQAREKQQQEKTPDQLLEELNQQLMDKGHATGSQSNLDKILSEQPGSTLTASFPKPFASQSGDNTTPPSLRAKQLQTLEEELALQRSAAQQTQSLRGTSERKRDAARAPVAGGRSKKSRSNRKPG